MALKQSGAWVLMFDGSNRLVLRKSGVADVASSTVTVTDTAGWHHVAATKDGASVHLYVDGVDVTGAVTAQVLVDNTLPLAIGQTSSGAFFHGGIDEVAVYGVALTGAQVAGRYARSAPPPPPPPGPPVNTEAPTISGTATVGETLTAAAGTWTGAQPIAYAYQWLRCDQAGDGCADLAGATSVSYLPADPDAGTTLRVLVTATNADGATSASSTQTAVVGAAGGRPERSGGLAHRVQRPDVLREQSSRRHYLWRAAAGCSRTSRERRPARLERSSECLEAHDTRRRGGWPVAQRHEYRRLVRVDCSRS